MSDREQDRVYLLVQEGRDYPDDPARPLQVHGVYETEADAQRALERDVRKPLHREYRIEEREVETVDQ